jgi:excisionase family DNA binding protein
MDELMTTEQVATYLTVPVPTIYQWRLRGGGPTAIRVGRHLRFRRSEVDAWLDAQADPKAG